MPNARLLALPLVVILAGTGNVARSQKSVPPANATQANRVVLPLDAGEPMAIAGHLPAWKQTASDLGAIGDSETVRLNVSIARSPEVQKAFEQRLADQQNPSSPEYHKWLTPQQVGQQFGPTQHDLDALTKWLSTKGFKIDGIPASRVVVQVSAPAAVVAAALGTTIHNYAPAGHVATEGYRAPSNDPTLPAALTPIVGYIDGLINVPIHMHSVRTADLQVVSPMGPSARTANASAAPDFTLSGGAHFLSPNDFATIYGLKAAYGLGNNGTGQKVMIIGGSRLTPSDLTAWENLSALAAYQPNYIVGSGFTDPGTTLDDNQGEGTLDFERVYGTAPGATVDMVIAKDWLNGTVNANLQLYAINTVNDPIMSLSFSSCEASQPAGYVAYESNSIYGPAAAQGISIFASSGDSGVAGCEAHGGAPPATQVASISDICASPYVTCVGGTQFADTANPALYWSSMNDAGSGSALGYIPEGAWNEPINGGSNQATVPFVVAATGGGPSTLMAKPSWQVGVGVPADGARDTPDISFSASGHNAYFSCLGYARGNCVRDANNSFFLSGFGGTSASAPSMAGIAALIDQKLGTRQGNINPLLYKTYGTTPAVFNDATPASSGVSGCDVRTPSTCNNSNAAPSTLTGGIAGYPLTAGYDLATGLGSLNVSAFLVAITQVPVVATTSTLTANPTSIVAGGTVQFTDKVTPATGTGVPTGTVSFTSTGPSIGNQTLVAGSATTGNITFPTAGTYSITASYGGDTLNAASVATLTFTVSGQAATTTVLTGTTGSVTTQQSVSYTATIASTLPGTLTGSVQFVRTLGGTITNLGAPVPVAGGKATLAATTLPGGNPTITANYSGDTNFAPSTSNGLAVSVTTVPSTIALSGVPATVTATTGITAVARVGSSSGSGAPTGTVQFLVDNVARGSMMTLSGSTASSAPIFLSAGPHTISVAYSGDSTFAPVTSATAAVTSTVTPVSISLTPVTASIASYQTVTLTATIAGLSPAVATASTVTFSEGTTALGPGTTTYSGTGGTSTFTAGPFTAGTHVITATFTGDGSYGAATSNTSTITVVQASVALAAVTPSFTTPAGAPVSDTINVTSANFSGTENLTCSFSAAGVPANLPTCTVAPASISFTGSGTMSAIVTINSIKGSAVTGAAQAANDRFRVTGLTGFGAAAVCGLFALCLPRRGRRTLGGLRRLHIVGSLLFLLGTLAAISGCGGNNFKGNPTPGTTAGNYTVTVSASNPGNNVTGSTTFVVTIQ